MRNMKSFFRAHKRSKKFLFMTAVLAVFSVMMVSSYAYFVITTSNYKASELLVAKLSYGINIVEDGSTGSTIESNTVNVPAGKKAFFFITVTSVNKIDSKYTLAYKTSSQAVVKYTDKTPWTSSGFIEGYDNTTYTKKIRVVIDNTSESREATVNFGVYGGYTFNSYTAISLGDGYYSVGGPYEETVATAGERLVDIVEKETGCVTTPTNNCTYGGGSIANYLQYPTNDDVSQNIWRILGTYQIGDKTVAKIVSDLTGSTTTALVPTSLSNFYGTLENVDNVVYKTNMFNCSSSGCTSSNYTNIGLITTFEYNSVGGLNSYLANTNSFFAIDGENISNITSGGIEGTTEETTSGLRPSIYLKTDLQVTGSGTASDPYRISQRSDINLVAYTLDGAATEKTFQYLLANNVVKEVVCEKGTKAVWDYAKNTITLSEVVVPDYCTINFGDGYTVNLVANNGTVTSPNPVAIGYNGGVSFEVSPNAGYKLEGATVSCNGGATAVLANGKVNVSGVTSAQTCTINMAKQAYKITMNVPNGSSNPPTKDILYKESGDFTISAGAGYQTTGMTVSCTGGTTATVSGTKITVSNVIKADTCNVSLTGKTYTVTASVSGGSANPTKRTGVAHGGSTTFTISANADNVLANATVSGTGCSLSSDKKTLTASNVTSDRTCTVTIPLRYKTLADTIKTAYAPVSGRTNFSSIDNGTPKLYTGSDDQGTTYYFSGDGSSMNNWVSFAGKKWRIIRINGNGSVRLLYAGNGSSATDIGSSAFNSTYNHPQYVGWKYTSGNSLATNRGNGTKSTIYSKVETWYTTNITNAGLTNYIDTGAIYCNDRNLRSGDSYSTSATFYYAAYGRLADNKAPTFNCSNTSDRFTTFGLMTADEVAFAGGKYGANSPKAYYYLAQDGTSSITGSSWWWTMSPYLGSSAAVFAVRGSSYPGDLNPLGVHGSVVVRPVVSLKSSVLVTGGSGTGSNPYTLTMQ